MQHYLAAKGSEAERYAIAGLMVAVEANEVTQERRQLTQTDQTKFMMGYECSMIWAIKTGAENVLNPKETQSMVLAMKRHLAEHGWHEAEAFDRIWERVDAMMPIAFNAKYGTDAPPPYPVAEMQLALDQAGYPLSQAVGLDVRFGIFMMLTMRELTKAAEATSR
jgi:hypothetical protein